MNHIYVDRTDQIFNSPSTEHKGHSSDAQTIQDKWQDIVIHYLTPATRESITKRFHTLTATWKQATQFSSSVNEIAMQPAYQEIIGMGRFVLPLIFNSMQSEPDHWFWALKAITGEDPIKPEDRGDIEKMTRAWLDWAQQNGY